MIGGVSPVTGICNHRAKKNSNYTHTFIMHTVVYEIENAEIKFYSMCIIYAILNYNSYNIIVIHKERLVSV